MVAPMARKEKDAPKQNDWAGPEVAHRPRTAPPLVWYVSFGSNLSADRFMCYIGGGRPPGGRSTLQGCSDKTPPRENRAFTLPHRVHFAGSSTWDGGGVAFLDHEEVDPGGGEGAIGRAWLITLDQFEQVVAQENGRHPGFARMIDPKDIESPSLTAVTPERYGTVRSYGQVEGHPMVTCTAPFSAADTKDPKRDRNVPGSNRPSAPYMWTMAKGIRECRDLTDAEIVDYLTSRPGSEGLQRSFVEAAVAARSGAAARWVEIKGGTAPDDWSDSRIEYEVNKTVREREQAAAPREATYPSARTPLRRPLYDPPLRLPGAVTEPSVEQMEFDRTWDEMATTARWEDPFDEIDGGPVWDPFERERILDDLADEYGFSIEELDRMNFPASWGREEIAQALDDYDDLLIRFAEGGEVSDAERLHVQAIDPGFFDQVTQSQEFEHAQVAALQSMSASEGEQRVGSYKRRNRVTGQIEVVSGYRRRTPPQNLPQRRT